MTANIVEALRQACVGAPCLTIAVAESLTCGQLQAAIGAVSGVSQFFLGGITAYSVDQKVRHLGVDRADAEPCEGASMKVARQMAIGACRMFDSDFAASTTGFAEPNPALGFPEPTAFFAIATDGGIIVDGCVARPGASRCEMQAAVVAEVLPALLEAVRAARR